MDRWQAYLFEAHSEEELRAWARRLAFFRFFRAYGGHANDGDALDVVFAYRTQEQMASCLAQLGVQLRKFDTQPAQAQVGVSYPGDVFIQFPSLIPGTRWLEQPGHCEVVGIKVFIWCFADRIKISVSDSWRVSEQNVRDAEIIEQLLRKVPLERIDPPLDTRNYISPKHYPQYFGV